jgi:predicted AAA+ superfamily ATPase
MDRHHYLDEISLQLQVQPVCAILGPRQVGKTTLAKEYAKKYYPEDSYFFDLEDPVDLARLDNPMLTLRSINQRLIVIDEIQLKPDLFQILRVLVDETRTSLDAQPDMKVRSKKFLILGSASRELLQQSSESLAGRIGYIELPPFSLNEVKNSKQLWMRGGFPNSYLASTDAQSYVWRQNYIKTFLEQDIPQLGFNIPATQMRRFWLMLAHYHGQIFNASEIGKSLGISDHMVRKYLDVLTGTFMVRVLLPWFENLHKRQVRSPKIYFRDSGILSALLNIEDDNQLYRNPRLGSFWEGFALEQIISSHAISAESCFYWSTQTQAELDLLIMMYGKRVGFEIKYMDAPKVTKSMKNALEDLKLDHLIVVYPGDKAFPLAEKIMVYGLEHVCSHSLHSLLWS